MNKKFDTKSFNKVKVKQKINPKINTNKPDLKINSYFWSELFILGTIAIIPLETLKPTIDVNREAENKTWDQKPISLNESLLAINAVIKKLINFSIINKLLLISLSLK